MDPVMDAMIVAGGAGSRLWPLTADTPKPLLEFCTAPFLQGVIRRLADCGVRRVFLVVGADTAPFEGLVGPARRAGVEVRFAPEPRPLDTAGGVRSVLDEVDGTFLVLNGDILTDVDLGAVIAAHHTAGAAATLVLTRVPDTSSFGVCIRDGERITAFLEKPSREEAGGHDTVNAGTYVLEPSALARFAAGPLSFEREVFPSLVRDGEHVAGFVSDAVWADLGTPSRFLAGHRLVLDGELHWPTLEDLSRRADRVWVGVDVEIDDGAQVRGPAILADGVRIAAGAVIGAHSVIGARTVVERQATVSAAVLGAGVQVGHDARLEGALVGAGAVIGPGARVGRRAVIRSGVRIDAGVSVDADATVPDRVGSDTT